jgi:hypothetical protein
LLGTVTDPVGAAVPMASVTVTNTETGVSSRTKCNGEGAYQITQHANPDYASSKTITLTNLRYLRLPFPGNQVPHSRIACRDRWNWDSGITSDAASPEFW